MKVLIAEDDSTSAIVLRKALEKLGHEAIVANDGEAAYAILSSDTAFNYRVVISDWMMPGMDGLELTRKLRAERKPGDPYRVVVLLTARGRPEDRRQGLDAGADDFMVKPLDMGDLIPRLSIAARMIALEDAVMNQGTAPAPTSTSVAGTVATPIASSASSGETEAASIVLAAVQDHESSELYFEPQKDRTCRVRIRIPGGKLQTLQVSADDARLAQQYLLSQATQRLVNFVTGGRTLTVEAKSLSLRSGGNQVYVRILNDTVESETPVTLDELPMQETIRTDLLAYIKTCRNQGGALLVSGKPTERVLATRTVNAIRQHLEDENTLILSTSEVAFTPAEAEEYDLGFKTDQYAPTPRYAYQHMTEQLVVLQKIQDQNPDVFIVEEFPISAIAHQAHEIMSDGRFLIVSSTRPGEYDYYSGSGNRTMLSVLPLQSDGGNAEDRFRLEYGTTDDVPNREDGEPKYWSDEEAAGEFFP